MTKLTTYEALKANIGKKIRFYHYDNELFGRIIYFDEEERISVGNFWLTDEHKNIYSIFNNIELIEEDNQESPAGKFTIVNEGEMIQTSDNINHPAHYTGKIECIDYLQDKLTAEEFKGFLKGNVLKYLSRATKKENELEDYKKGKWYLEKLITTMEKK
jgi:hypothetical protein